MNTIARKVYLLAVLANLSGCSSGSAPVDIGDAKTGDKLEDYVAVWEGYAEAHNFKDGSDKVKISIDASGHGTLVIGDTPAWPVAVNPDVGYPPNLGLRDQPNKLFPGVSYPIDTATVDSGRVRISVNPFEAFRDWCGLQTSYPLFHGPSCLPGSLTMSPPSADCFYSDADGDLTPVDCVKGLMCEAHACSCDAQGCSVLSGPAADPNYTKLDAALFDGGNSLVGTLRVGHEMLNDSMTVRLTRH